MFRKVLTAGQIQQEVHRRVLLKPPASGYPWEVSLPLPKAHAPDAEARNWVIETVGRVGYGAYGRHVVDDARKEFLLSDAAERDGIMGDFSAHG